jgi:RNA recognition motif-containing protein
VLLVFFAGSGNVRMSNDAEADAAIAKWNGADFEGRKLTVNEARPLEARPPRRNGGFDRGGNSNW